MNKIQSAFDHGKAFIAFLTAGDPNLEATEELICAMEQAGADLIEIGIPFSDPVAEGEVIERANMRALSQGVKIDHIFGMAQRVRQKVGVPLVFLTYVNPIFVYGVDKFMKQCAQCGIDGVIVPDLPFEEKGEILPKCREYGVNLISLIAPSSGERIRSIAKEAEGFVYCVSSMGVTGVRSQIQGDVASMVQMVKEENSIPCAVGFGVSTPEQASQIAAVADGVIVGSAIVKIIEQYGEESKPYVFEYVKKMKEAVMN